MLDLPEPRRPVRIDIPTSEPARRKLVHQGPIAYYDAAEYAEGVSVSGALHFSGLDVALRIYASEPKGTVLLSVSTIDHLVRALLSSPFPAPNNVSIAADILIEQLNSHLRRPAPLPAGFRNVAISAMRVLGALSTSVAVPRRWDRAHAILDLINVERFPVHSRHSIRIPLAEACYRSGSHTDAIATLSRDTRPCSEDWKRAVGILGRTRFDARNFMSADDLLLFLVQYEARGGVVTAGLFLSYIKALTLVAASVRQPHERRMLTGRRGPLRRIRETVHVLEREIIPRYPAVNPAVSRPAVCLALLGLYLRLPHDDAEIARCWTAIMTGSARLRARAAGVIAAFPLDAVHRLWEDLLISGASPPVWDLFGAALARGGAYADAVHAIAERLSADAGLLAADPAENSVNALLQNVSLPEGSVRRVLKYLGRAQTCHRPFLFPVASSTLEPVRS